MCIYCDYCVYHYKSTELVSLYTLDIGLKINIIIIIIIFDMSKTFDTINIHTLIGKLLQTKITGTIIKFIANYINGRKAYTTYRNHTSSQHQFKTGVPQGGVLSPTLFNIYIADIPPQRKPVQNKAYADDITITSTHTSKSADKKYIQPYLHKVFAWTK